MERELCQVCSKPLRILCEVIKDGKWVPVFGCRRYCVAQKEQVRRPQKFGGGRGAVGRWRHRREKRR